MFISINVKIIHDFKLSCPVESKCTAQLYLNFNDLISKVKLSFQILQLMNSNSMIYFLSPSLSSCSVIFI